jgi:hypothetical protein
MNVFTLRMATAIFAETLDRSQYSTLFVAENRRFITVLLLALYPQDEYIHPKGGNCNAYRNVVQPLVFDDAHIRKLKLYIER